VEIDRVQQTPLQRKHHPVLEQMRLAPGLPPPPIPPFITVLTFRQAKLDAGVRLNQHMVSYGDRPNDYDSISNCLFYCDIDRTSSYLRSDFRNKFGALHQSYTPNRERELYSTTVISLHEN
jgi:hypothetical protein